MKTAKVTYNAPAGDSKVVEMGGVTFFHGQPVEINDVDNPHMMVKLPGNQHFTFEADSSEPQPVKRGPGRPPKVDPAAEVQ